MTTLADKARKALEGATPGPWEVHHNEHHPGALTVEGPTIRCLGFTIASDVDEKGALQRIRDANLIALAPDLARAYLDTLNKLEKAEKTMRFAADRIKTMLEAVGEMEAEQDKLRKALEDIAYQSGAPDDLEWCQRKARAALKQEGDQ